MPVKAKFITMLMVAGVLMLASRSTAAQGQKGQATGAGAAKTASAADMPERLKVLRAAADALGMIRWSDIGAGSTILPGIDAVNTIELFGSGTCESGGQQFTADYHVALAYNPPAMRVEVTRTSPDQVSGAVPKHTIQVVREKYAWDESELGGGLVPGKGTATPAMSEAKVRFLRLWILPYGVVKAGVAAGDKTKVSSENGATVITFPLSGEMAGVTMKATLDAKNYITKVETRSDNPAMAKLATETEYSDYKDHGDIPTDVKSPGHVTLKQGGHTVLDIQIKMVDANNPYLVFPVPPSVKAAGEKTSASN
jgi:hypothetical protein